MTKAKIHVDPRTLGRGQAEFLRSMDPFVGLFGGFGSGKSTALMLKVLQLVCANPGLPGLLIAQSYSALHANIVDPLFELMKRNGSMAVLRPKLCLGRYQRIEFSNGSVVHLRSAERPAGYDGLTVAWLAGDEIRHWRKRAYDIAIGRVRIKRAPLIQRVFSSTPAMNWVNDEFNSDKPRRLISAPTIENIRYLPPDYIDNLRQSYSKAMQRAVLEGLFTILEGAVFEDFNPSIDSQWMVALDPTRAYLEPRKNFLAVDPGYRRSSWLWIVENDDEDWIVYDQLMGENMNDAACVREVNARGWPVDEIWFDPAGKARQSYEGMSTLDALTHINTRQQGAIMTLRGANRDIAYGIDKMRVLLGDDEGERPIRLRFAQRLHEQERGRPRGIIKDIAGSQYPEPKYGQALSEVPLKDGLRDHSRDALRYWSVGMFLTNDNLRKTDPILASKTKAGYTRAA